jgi:hypothetical protein
VITADPGIAGTWRYHARLNHRMWRLHSNHNLLAEGADGQKTREKNSDQWLL